MHDDLVCVEGWLVSGIEDRIGAAMLPVFITPDSTSRPTR
jgi:hypothetical protein